MRVRATASSLLIAAFLCLSAAIPEAAQQPKQQPEWAVTDVIPEAAQQPKQQPEGTWTDRNGKERSRADLDEILKQHELWVTSGGKSGTQADLSRAGLRHADLGG